MDDDDLRGRVRALASWLDASPAEVAGLGVLLLGAVAVAVVLWWTSRPAPMIAGGDGGGTDPGSVALEGTLDVLTVHVAGAVAVPGLVTVDVGARVADAITAAGGPAVDADLDPLNLARAVSDGERIEVPRLGGSGSAGVRTAGPGTGARRSDGRLDLNVAAPGDLETLPGVGPVLAERIVSWREDHGPFTEVGQLREVAGIGEKTFQALADLVAV
jgi:competence protein ComEA